MGFSGYLITGGLSAPYYFLPTRGLCLSALDSDVSILGALYKYLQLLEITENIYYADEWQELSYPATVFEITDDDTYDMHQEGVGKRRAVLQVDVLTETVSEAEEALESYYRVLADQRINLGVTGYTDVCIYDEGLNLDETFLNDSLNKKIEVRGNSYMVVY